MLLPLPLLWYWGTSREAGGNGLLVWQLTVSLSSPNCALALATDLVYCLCNPCRTGESPLNSAEEGPPHETLLCTAPPEVCLVFGWHLPSWSHKSIPWCLSLMRTLISSNLWGSPIRGLWAHSRIDWYRELVLTSFVWPNHHPFLLCFSAATPEPGWEVKWRNKMSVYSFLGALSQEGEILCLLQGNGVGGNTAFPSPFPLLLVWKWSE